MPFITPDLKIESMRVCICAVWLTDQVDSSKLLLLLLACSCGASDSILTYYGTVILPSTWINILLVVFEQLSNLVQKPPTHNRTAN